MVAAKAARAEANAISSVVITRERLIGDARTAYNLAERQSNVAGMLGAIKLLAELGQVSLRCPQDRPQPSQHVHLHELVDLPPRESLAQWTRRKQQELEQRQELSAKQPGPSAPRSLKLVDNDD
jgi:hypothetical protein